MTHNLHANSYYALAHKHKRGLCVARCGHDYGLRTSLAKEVEAQMSIVTQFTRRFGPI